MLTVDCQKRMGDFELDVSLEVGAETNGALRRLPARQDHYPQRHRRAGAPTREKSSSRARPSSGAAGRVLPWMCRPETAHRICLPELCIVPAPVGSENVAYALWRREGRATAPRSCWNGCTSPTSRTYTRASSPAASSNGSRWRGRWRRSRSPVAGRARSRRFEPPCASGSSATCAPCNPSWGWQCSTLRIGRRCLCAGAPARTWSVTGASHRWAASKTSCVAGKPSVGADHGQSVPAARAGSCGGPQRLRLDWEG